MHFGVFVQGACGAALTNVSVSLCAGMALQGHTADLVTLWETRERILEHYREIPGIERIEVVPLNVHRTLWCLPPLYRYLRSRRPTALFSQLLLCNLAATVAAMLARSPTRLILLEGTLISRVASVEARRMPFLSHAVRCARLLYPRADGIVAKSPAIEADLRHELGRRGMSLRIAQLPNPYVFDRIRFLAQEPVALPHTTAEPVLVSAGRLAEQKAFDVLLHAVAELRTRLPCKLLILGDGPEHVSLLALAQKLQIDEHVQFLGRVSNPWKYMHAAQLFVLPSRWEGMSSALIEAAALGCAIVTSEGALSGSTWLEHGKAAWVVPTDDAPALARAIEALLASPALRTQLGRAARQAAERYDYVAVAEQYVRFATADAP